MEFLQDNYQNLILIVGAVYPALIFLLPPQIATKISLGIKIIKVVAQTLEKAQNTKSGFSLEPHLEENKTFTQKSRN